MDNRSKDVFLHEALDTSRNEVRLFRIVYDGSPRLSCHLQTFELDACPSYVALSYVWGPRTPIEGITVNGHDLAIRANLHAFLLSLRNGLEAFELPLHRVDSDMFCSEPKALWFWCDQICIQQSNLPERSHQVALMGRLFSQASETIAWVGAPEPEEEGFLDLDALDDGEVGAVLRDKYGHDVTSNLLSLVPFVRSAYWSRLWVVQEVLLSRKLHFVCESRIIVWSALRLAFDGLFTIPYQLHIHIFGRHRGALANGTRLLDARHDAQMQRQRYHDLGYLIKVFATTDCEDARDKVFGLLGLVDPSRRPRIDYGMTRRELYFDVLSKTVGAEYHVPLDQRLTASKHLRWCLELGTSSMGVSDEELGTFIFSMQQSNAERPL